MSFRNYCHAVLLKMLSATHLKIRFVETNRDACPPSCWKGELLPQLAKYLNFQKAKVLAIPHPYSTDQMNSSRR